MRRPRLILVTAATALVGAAALPTSANAAVTCAFDDAVGAMVITPGVGDTQVRVQRSGDSIQVFDRLSGGTVIACMPTDTATVNNTISITVNDATPGQNTTTLFSQQGGVLAPGRPPAEATGASEIELAFNGGDGTDQLQFDGTDNADNILFGEAPGDILGANLNGDDDADDLIATGVEQLIANGRRGDDEISAVGNAAIPAIAAPLTLPLVQLEGGNQNDRLRGGSGPDMLVGGTQDDDLLGGAGGDTLLGENDNDSFDGGAGGDSMDGGTGTTDVALYSDRTTSQNVNIDGLANDGGSEDSFADNVLATIENVKTGSGADFITGSSLVNDLTGNAGNDTVNGAGGNDKVSGSAGVDRVLGAAGNDKLFGGTEQDNLVGGSGNDKATGNSGKDILLGKNGIDRLIAADGTRDKRINCGKGSNKKESFTRDRKDPKAKSC